MKKFLILTLLFMSAHLALAGISYKLVDGLTYYELLEVKPDASYEDIKISFRRLARKNHPDKPDGNEELQKEISNAYDVLKDVNKRKDYDRWLNGTSKSTKTNSSSTNTRQKSNLEIRMDILHFIVQDLQTKILKYLQQYPQATLQDLSEVAFANILYNERYLPDALMNPDDLWHLFNDYALNPYIYKQWNQDTMISLAAASYRFLKEKPQHLAQPILNQAKQRMLYVLNSSELSHERVLFVDKIWQVLFERSYFYRPKPEPNPNTADSCTILMAEGIYTDGNGTQWKIPIQVKINIGFK